MKSILIGILGCIPFIVVGQIKFINTNLNNTDTSLLYGNIDNKLELVGQKYQSGLHVTSSLKSEIIPGTSGVVIRPNRNNGIDTLRLFNGKRLLLTQTFRISKINDPIPSLAFSYDTIIPRNKILSNPYLIVKLPNSLYKLEFSMLSFECIITKKNGEKNIFLTAGNKLSDEMIANIRSLSPHDKIIFQNIKIASPPSFCPKSAPSLTITIQ